MGTLKTSWQKVFTFVQIANGWKAANEQKKTKLHYAIDRVLSQVDLIQKRVNQQFEDIDDDLCMVAEEGENKGAILKGKDDKPLFTKDNEKERKKRQRVVIDNEDIEIEPYLARELPEEIADYQLLAFCPFVVSDEMLAEYRDKVMRDEYEVADSKSNGLASPSLAALR